MEYNLQIIFAASFFISVYYAYQRTWKPFNPILGETYEMVNHGDLTFIAEQVRFNFLYIFFSSSNKMLKQKFFYASLYLIFGGGVKAWLP